MMTMSVNMSCQLAKNNKNLILMVPNILNKLFFSEENKFFIINNILL